MVADSNEFTERERTLMALAWQSFDVKPKVDYKKLAALAGFTNPASASNAWGKISKKLQAQGGNAVTDGTASTPKSATGKRRGKSATAERGEDDDDEETPAKKSKAAPRKRAFKEEPVEDEEEEQDFMC